MSSQSVTWDMVLNNDPCLIDANVYVVHGADGCILYVGKSGCAVTRLQSHVGVGEWCGFGISRTGQFVLDNLPLSKGWKIDLYSIDECKAIYPSSWWGEEQDWIDHAEQCMIDYLKPKFNVINTGSYK